MKWLAHITNWMHLNALLAKARVEKARAVRKPIEYNHNYIALHNRERLRCWNIRTKKRHGEQYISETRKDLKLTLEQERKDATGYNRSFHYYISNCCLNFNRVSNHCFFHRLIITSRGFPCFFPWCWNCYRDWNLHSIYKWIRASWQVKLLLDLELAFELR